MSESVNIRPTLLIDLMRDKIRIHRSTMLAMGNPEYIALIINPDKLILGIVCSSINDKRAHKVRYNYLHQSGQSYELHSKALINSLKLLCPEWKDGEKYKLYGKICPYDNSARFDMSEAALKKEG